MEMGSWEYIMSKVTDVTQDEDRETKGTSQGKQEAQYNKLGKNGREVCNLAKNSEKPGWRRWESLNVWNTQEYMISARFQDNHLAESEDELEGGRKETA